jgi:hypothetical protein
LGGNAEEVALVIASVGFFFINLVKESNIMANIGSGLSVSTITSKCRSPSRNTLVTLLNLSDPAVALAFVGAPIS